MRITFSTKPLYDKGQVNHALKTYGDISELKKEYDNAINEERETSVFPWPWRYFEKANPPQLLSHLFPIMDFAQGRELVDETVKAWRNYVEVSKSRRAEEEPIAAHERKPEPEEEL